MKVRQRELAEKADTTKAAACFRAEQPKMEQLKPEPETATDEDIIPGTPGKTTQEVNPVMTLDELKKENPDVYTAAMKAGADEYKAGNDERLKKLAEMKASDEYKDIPEIVEVIDAAMLSGDSVQSTETKMMAAMMKVMKDPAKMAAIESPADISGGEGAEDDKPATHMEA